MGALALTLASVGAACSEMGGSSDALFGETPPMTSDAGVAAEFVRRVQPTPTLLTDITLDVEAALLGYAEVLLEPVDLAVGGAETGFANPGWEMNFEWSPRSGDRAMLGLMQLGIEVERVGPTADILVGPGAPDVVMAQIEAALEAVLDPEAPDMAQARLAAQVEAGGAPTDASGAQRVELAELPVLCLDRLPLIGGGGCGGRLVDGAGDGPEPVVAVAAQAWRRGITGDLTPGAPQRPSSAEGGVSWNNREAQAYVPEQVDISDDGAVRLRATVRTTPSVDVLPYASGLVFAPTTFEWGTLEATLTLPFEPGLWPALWLLGTEACEAPGRCAGFETPSYHEIDLLETRSQQPDELHTSVHWFDERIRTDTQVSSRSAVAATDASIGDSQEEAGAVTIELERRPGLLRWLVDGVEVHRVTGPALADTGPHRLSEFLLIANLAVGGSFAGDQLVGRAGEWWGDARVPAGFPNLAWSEAIVTISQPVVRPLATG